MEAELQCVREGDQRLPLLLDPARSRLGNENSGAPANPNPV
jgi:hypothetical protein